MLLYDVPVKLKKNLGILEFEAFSNALGEVDGDEKKVQDLALSVKNYEAFNSAIQEEIKNLKERIEHNDIVIENVKKYFKQKISGEKFTFPNAKISWKKSTKLVETDDFFEDDFIEKYKETEFIEEVKRFKIKKNLIKKAIIDDDKKFDGFEIDRLNNVTIK